MPATPAWLFSRDALPAMHRTALAPPYIIGQGVSWPPIAPEPLPGGRRSPILHVDWTRRGWPMTPFHLATNLPLFMRKSDQVTHVIPKLASAGVVVWRWPGGAIGDAWCPTTSKDSYPDECFTRYPALRQMGHPGTPPTFLDLAEFIRQCVRFSCVPIVQINAAVAMIYGANACADLTANVLGDFAAAGIGVRYLEFGNEVYGYWWPAGAQLPQRSGATYASAFVSTREALLARLPPSSAPLSFGLVMTRSIVNNGDGGTISRWNNDILQSPSGAAEVADWLIIHRYFSKCMLIRHFLHMTPRPIPFDSSPLLLSTHSWSHQPARIDLL